eukprot:7527716-Pyramimonas_sp.AAC.1
MLGNWMPQFGKPRGGPALVPRLPAKRTPMFLAFSSPWLLANTGLMQRVPCSARAWGIATAQFNCR